MTIDGVVFRSGVVYQVPQEVTLSAMLRSIN